GAGHGREARPFTGLRAQAKPDLPFRRCNGQPLSLNHRWVGERHLLVADLAGLALPSHGGRPRQPPRTPPGLAHESSYRREILGTSTPSTTPPAATPRSGHGVRGTERGPVNGPRRRTKRRVRETGSSPGKAA